ncbi:MAG: VOC family protein [Deinococcus sp.]|nr:VOC family protein [Deinococcus sp.]
MAHSVMHWEIAAKDAKKLQDFYAKVFGWKISTNNPMNYGMVETGGKGGINGGIFQTDGNIPSYVTFYITVEDLQAYLDKAESLGGKTVVPPTPIPDVGSFAMFTDPEGHCLGLFKELG